MVVLIARRRRTGSSRKGESAIDCCNPLDPPSGSRAAIG